MYSFLSGYFYSALFKVYPYYVSPQFIPFYCRVVFHCVDMARLVYSFACSLAFECFQFGAVTNEALYGHVLG